MTTPHPWRGVREWAQHGLVLTVAGFMYICIGVALLFAVLTPSQQIAVSAATKWLSLDGWGVLFIFAGLLSILSSRWPPLLEKWGYFVLTGLSVAWGGLYLVSLFNGAPLSNVASAATWGLIAFLWWAISGLVNPQKKG